MVFGITTLLRLPAAAAGKGASLANGLLTDPRGKVEELVAGVDRLIEEAEELVEHAENAVEHADADDVEEVVEDIVEQVEETLEHVEETLEHVEDVVGEVVGESVELVEESLGRHRRVWTDDGHDRVQIEARGITRSRATRLRERLQRSLEQMDGVRWAEVNAVTGKVAVALTDTRTPVSSLVAAVEAVEDAHGLRKERFDERRAAEKWDVAERADHPADAEPIHRAIATLAGDSVGLGWSVVGRAARVARIPIEFAALIPLIENHPWLRAGVEQVLGRRATELGLPLASAFANSVAQGPTGIVVDMAYQASLLTELRARRAVWCRREPEFYSRPSKRPIEPPTLPPRDPLRAGPVERASERLAAASLAGFGVTLAATRNPRRAADAFLAGIPKAARLGREGFAAQLGRTLAARGIVPLDASALRRLDRIDTVVIDSDVLVAGGYAVAHVDALGDLPEETVETLADGLLDPDALKTPQEAGDWWLGPVDDLPEGGVPPRGLKTRLRDMQRAGLHPLVLCRGGEAVGAVGVAAVLNPATDVLAEAVRRAGHRLLVAGRKGDAGKLVEADDVLPRGKPLGAAVRRLQAEGAVVAVIAQRGKHGLAAADVGIGLTRRTGRPPWGADLVCGHDLVDTAFVVEASAVAADVSQRSAHFAVAGSGLGALAALTGPAASAGRRSLAIVNGAGAAALAAGTWSAVTLAQRPRPVVIDPTPWHALWPEAVLDRLESGAEGLPPGLAEERRRARRRGGSEIGPVEPYLAELMNPLNPILGVGAALAAATGSLVDAGLVGGLVGVNTLVGGLQRQRTERAVAGLLQRTATPARVLRDGEEQVVDEQDLVPGDVVLLRAGDVVPADCRVLSAEGLEVDEATLTGESLPVAKHAEPTAEADAIADRQSMLFEDTTVAAGEGSAVVVATGPYTEVARSVAVAGTAGHASGVEQRLDALTRRILPGVLAAAGAVGVAGLLRGWPVPEIASTGVSLAVASVPEGLPLIANAGQLAAARRLSRRGVIVRDPRTIEALGRVQVVCCDKTGTLTEGRISLQLVSDGVSEERISDLSDRGRETLAAALRATPPAETANGDTTDSAVREAGASAGVGVDCDVGSWERVAELPFEPTRGLNAALGRCADGHRLSVKGAPEHVLPACARWRRGGETVALDRARLAQVEECVDDLAGRGFRVLAVAERVASDRTELPDERVERLDLVGLIALADRVRATAAQAIAGIREAGVRVVMVTGDHPSTAVAIAAELGLDAEDAVVTGAELDALDDEALDERIDTVAVFARVSPAHKVRIVSAFQRRGVPVAMTGDGANDAASIRLADVGVALGADATPAARDAADVVVTDDRVETLIDGIAEGRALWGSVREALGILVGGNLGEVGFTVAASMLSRSAPVNARQLLLVNLVTDLAPALAIAVRPPADHSPERLLREGPEASLGSALTQDIAVRAVATGLAGAGAWTAARLTGTRRRAGTVGLAAVVGAQLGQTVVAGRGRGPIVVATAAGSAAALVAAVQTPGVSQFFGCRPLGALGWTQAGVAAGLATAGSWAAGRLLVPRAT